MEVHVRAATQDDVISLAEMLRAAEHPRLADDLAGDVTRGGRRGGWIVLVAVDEGDRVLGVLEGRFEDEYSPTWVPPAHRGPQGWVGNLVVLPSVRRQGVGRQLLQAFSHQGAARGRTYVALWVSPHGDVDSRRTFFERCGLGLIGVDNGHVIYGAPTMDLSPPSH